MSDAVPLSVLDLSPISSGSTAAHALHQSVDLARQAESLGYRRYWVAEHHFAPGVASAAPGVLIAAIAAATQRIRVGSAAVLLGHRTALDVAEQFGTLAGLHPDRIDLGVGRSGRPGPPTGSPPIGSPPIGSPPTDAGSPARSVDGLLIPAPFSFAELLASPRFTALQSLLYQTGATSEPFDQQLDAIVALLEGRYTMQDGEPVSAASAEAGRPDLWLLGSSGGESARVAGERGLPFAANYHVNPAGVLDAVESYRSAFRPSARLRRPHVVVSLDAVVGPDDQQAQILASGFALWVLSIRSGAGARPFPSAQEAAQHQWTEQERRLVADRVRTQFVGAPSAVVERMTTLQRVTGADELLVTTITHEHADRVRSYHLLSQAWARVGARGRPQVASGHDVARHR